MKKISDIKIEMIPVSGIERQEKPLLCAPNCEICHGSGWMRVDVSMDHPLFGKVLPCDNAPITHPYFDRFGLLPSERENLNWQSLRNLDNVLEAAEKTREIVKSGWGMVYLWGDNGKAKSLLLKICVADWLRKKRGGAQFVMMADLLDDLRIALADPDNGARQYRSRNEYWQGIPLLAIDEIDVMNHTEFATERRFIILDRRYERAMNEHESLTLMASNEPPDQLPRSIYDRIRDGRNIIIRLTGESVRPALRRIP